MGRLTNAMQYNRLKFNCAAMRCAALETPPLPVRAPRYTDATLPQPTDFGGGMPGGVLAADKPDKKKGRKNSKAAQAAAQQAAAGPYPNP